MTIDTPPPSDAVPPAERSGLRIPLICCWLLMLVTFSAPGRESPRDSGGLDVIGLAKLGVRVFVVLILTRELARHWNDPGRRVVVWCFTPFAAFVGWSLATCAWSPLKVISLGQWGGLLGQSLLAAVIALRWSGPHDTARLLRHLCFALVAVSTVLSAIDFASHDLSGLNRDEFQTDASNGLVHPTSAGATGSLGIVLLVASRMLWTWPWLRSLFLPGLAACATLLLLSHSRMALAMTGIVLGLAFLRLATRELLASAIIGASLLGVGYLMLDPGLVELDHGRKELSSYWRRGETDEQMSSLNGRGDLWEAVWDELQYAPIQGHGYFLTSRTGILDVWSGPAVRTAHNFLLQALASTGAIGLVLFAWGIVRPVHAAAPALRGFGDAGKTGLLLLLLGIWYLGWGQLCESFLGPIQPESVCFYSLLGLTVSQAKRGAVA
ncbi:MAG: O-antigen ligase family protein [Gemmataceae bacterium]